MITHLQSITRNFLLTAFTLASSSHAQIKANVTLGNLLHTYNGSPKFATSVTIPAGLPTQITYQDINSNRLAPISEIVYDDTPATLNLSYFSVGFSTNSLTAVGNHIKLGGTSRELDSCDVVLVTWAKSDSWPELKTANPAGYMHPITISIYELSSNNEIILRTQATKSVLIPWRPLTQLNGQPYPFNGFAFRTNIEFENKFILPEKIIVAVSFDTQFSGEKPIGRNGPYNSLNVAHIDALNNPLIGFDVDQTSYFQLKRGIWEIIANSNTESIPMIRLKASSRETTTPPTKAGTWLATAAISNTDYTGSDQKTFIIQPAIASIDVAELSYTYNTRPVELAVTTRPPGLPVSLKFGDQAIAPTNAGSYRIVAQITDQNYTGNNTATLNIAKANAIVTQSNLIQIADGRPKPITVTTNPINLIATTTYTDASTDGLTPPTALGKYAVTSVITDPNYYGSATGELWLGQNIQSWINRWLDNNSIPENEKGDDDDPDHDNISNLLEYAFGLDPSKPDLSRDIPPVEFQDDKLSFCYLKNLAATDLEFEVESSTKLSASETWGRAVATETVIKTEGSVQTVRVTVETPDKHGNQFSRMKISRANR